jgi:N-acetylglucosamine kinase-like BadF-type ATPase
LRTNPDNGVRLRRTLRDVALVAGVDVGGSKTLAAVAAESGHIVGVGSSGGGNRQLVGADGFRTALDAALDQALTLAGAARADLVALHVGAAGLDFAEDGDELRAALGSDYANAVVENDALLGLYAGTSSGWGGVVVAGSGTNAAAVAPDGTTLFVGGLGWHCGDSGGAAMLGVEAQRLAIRSWEEREPPTLLTRLLVEHMDVAGMDEVFRRVATFAGPDALEVAQLVAQAAREGDALAAGLLESHGRDMGLAVGTALRRLGIADIAPEVVGLGGMFPMCEGTQLFPSFSEEVRRHAPDADVHVLGTEPVVGAVVAALRRTGAEVDVSVVRESWPSP